MTNVVQINLVMHHKRQGTQVSISTGMQEDGGPLRSRVRALPPSPHKHRNVNKLNFKQTHVLGRRGFDCDLGGGGEEIALSS